MALIGQSLEAAASYLRQGQPVAVPTETVYGLAANALDAEALLRVFEVKERPLRDPLIVHLASVDQLERYAKEVPEPAYKLLDAFSPGPLTLILPKSSLLPDLLSAGLPTAGFRIPAHPLTLELLRMLDLPLAAPSANLFGRISPTTASHVADQLGTRIPYILDGGPCRVGIESTILDLSGSQPVLLREGGITADRIMATLGLQSLHRQNTAGGLQSQPSGSGLGPPSGSEPGQPSGSGLGPPFGSGLGPPKGQDESALKAPGTLLHHYAPVVPLLCYQGDPDLMNLLGNLNDHGSDLFPVTPRNKVGFLRYRYPVPVADHRDSPCEILSPAGDLTEAARQLYGAMRRLEKLCDLILAELLPAQGLGAAVNDRLLRASARP